MFGLTYVFSRIVFLQIQLKKFLLLKFGQFLKSPPDSGDGDGDCDRHGEFWSPPVKCGPLHIYRDSQKNCWQKSQC